MNANNTTLLDRALWNLSAEQRSRVLDLTVHLDLDRDDPVWLILIAVNRLQILVEDTPADWQTLFTSFQEELRAWTDTHLETLETIARKAETEEALARTCNELVISLGRLTSTCSELMTRLPTSLPAWNALASASPPSTPVPFSKDLSDRLELIWRELTTQREILHRHQHQFGKQLSRSADHRHFLQGWLVLLFGVQLSTLVLVWMVR